MVKDELKYRDLGSAGFDLVLGRFPFHGEHLGRLLIREASKATIFLADSESYALQIFRAKLDDGAEFSVDFSFGDVVKETAKRMIQDVPLYRTNRNEFVEADELLSPSASRFSSTRFPPRSKVQFDTPRILEDLGGRLRDAEVFTARAYSMLDFDDKINAYENWEPNSYFRSLSLRRAMLVPRVFDKDHAASIKVLNDSMSALQRPGDARRIDYDQLVREEDSRTVDALQAADIAAGLARETLDRKGLRSLAAQFGRVLLNGLSLDRLSVSD